MQMTGAELIVNVLKEQGCDTVFGYPGGTVIDLYDALYKEQASIRHILTAHEQGASHAADGYARATGKVGVVLATSGPGATNLVTGIATAMLDSIPIVAITGNVATSMIGKDSFQEVNILGVTMPITKHNYFVTDVNDLADVLREAFQIAKSGRPGPVLVDVPKDVQTALCDYVPAEVAVPAPAPETDAVGLEAALELIRHAERPFLYVGGGAARADAMHPGVAEKIVALAERLDAFIGSTFMGLSVVSSEEARFLGMQGMHGRYESTMANKNADLILGVGVRFSDRATGKTSRFAPNAKIIQLDADVSEINKSILVDVGLVGGLQQTLDCLLERLEPQQHPAWRDQVAALREKGVELRAAADAATPGAITPMQVFEVLNQVKQETDIVVTDVGQHQMWAAQYTRLMLPRKFISSGGLGTMGFGMGAAIGAHIGSGERTILITGDGSFAMNLNELATAVTYGVPMTIVLLNNHVLGMVRQWQTLFYSARHSSTSHGRVTDYVALTKAFGGEAVRAEDAASFRAALEQSMLRRGPTLIEVAIDPDALVLPMLPPGGGIDDMITSKEEAYS